MSQRAIIEPASSLLLYVFFACVAVGCSAVTRTPGVAFAVDGSAIAEVTAADAPRATPSTPSTPDPRTEPAPAAVSADARGVDDVIARSCRPDGGAKCVLPPADADAMCRSMTPTSALRLFESERLRVGFLTRDVIAWSTGPARRTQTRALFDEQVIVLSKRPAKNVFAAKGAAVRYEVLRRDGTCASLTGDDVTFTRAPRPSHAL